MTTVYERLKALQIDLPDVPVPVVAGYDAAFVPFVHTGNLVYLSGRLAKKDGKPWSGKMGEQITTLEGKQAARGIAIELLATLQSALGGPGQDKTDREAAGDGEQHTEFYRAARGCQRRVRTFPGNLWRAWSACAQHVWLGADSIWGVCGDRPHCRGHRPGRWGQFDSSIR